MNNSTWAGVSFFTRKLSRISRTVRCDNGNSVSSIVSITLSDAVTFLLLAFILVGLVGLVGCQKVPESHEKITVAVAIQPLSAPVYVAQEMGFFKEEGLDVTLQPYVSGKDCLASVLSGTAEIGTVAETPIMLAALNGEKFSIIATISDSNQYQKIVARKDRGITAPKDLIGKRIGMNAGTTTEYFLDALLTYYGIPMERTRKITAGPEGILAALAKGDIDAAVVWPPHTAKALTLLGNNALTLEDDKIYSIYWNIVTGQEFAQAHPETVKKLLRAFLRAERYINSNSAAVSAIMAKILGDGVFTTVGNNFDLYQGQNLLLAMEDQARWAINKRLTGLKEVPNFLPYFYAQGMKAVAPEAISSGLDTGKE